MWSGFNKADVDAQALALARAGDGGGGGGGPSFGLTYIQTNDNLTLTAANVLVEVIEVNKTITLPLAAGFAGQMIVIIGSSGGNVGLQAQGDDIISSRHSPVAGQGLGPWHPSGDGAVLFADNTNTWLTADD